MLGPEGRVMVSCDEGPARLGICLEALLRSCDDRWVRDAVDGDLVVISRGRLRVVAFAVSAIIDFISILEKRRID